MKNLLLSLILACSLNAADNEVDVLVLGVSHHFQNRDYGYREFNPGSGIGYWHGNDLKVGIVASQYVNSYNRVTRLVVPGIRYTMGDAIQYGAQVGIGKISGYEDTNTIPFAALFVEYKGVALEGTYIPCTGEQEAHLAPKSAAVALWLRFKVLEW